MVIVLVLAWAAPASAQRDAALEHYEQGEAYMKAEQYDLAAKEYLLAYKASSKSGFLFNAGLALEKAGDAKGAVVEYRRYLDKAPNGRAAEETRARLAKLERVLAKRAEAKAAEQQRRDEEAKRQLAAAEAIAAAEVHAQAERFDEAVAAYERAYEASKNPERLYDIADVFLAKGDAREARVRFEAYLVEAPTGDRHVAARRHIDEITAALDAQRAAATAPTREPAAETVTRVREPPPPQSPWGIGVELGVAQIDPGHGGTTGEFCEEQALVNPTARIVVAYRFHRRFSAQLAAGALFWAFDLDCTSTSESGPDITVLQIPATARLHVLTSGPVRGVLYGGVQASAPMSTGDGVDGGSLTVGVVGGVELGAPAGPGTILVDVGVASDFGAEYTIDTTTDSTLTIDGTFGVAVFFGYRTGR